MCLTPLTLTLSRRERGLIEVPFSMVYPMAVKYAAGLMS